MPTVSVDLDADLHAWICRRAREHDSSPAVELAALAAAARTREQADDGTTLPVGVYEADDGTTVVEVGDPDDGTELPVGVYDDSTDAEDSGDSTDA
ncbi:MAG: hypothetical protein ACOC0Z_02440 [Halohasta sp.]